MKRLVGLFCACFVTSLLLAVTSEQIAAWKLRFPAVSVAEPYVLRQLASTYEQKVSAITKDNMESVVWSLRERAERDVLAEKEFAGRGGLTGSEAKAKIAWLQNRLLPFLNQKL